MAIVHDEFAMGGVVPLLFNPPVGLMEAVFGLKIVCSHASCKECHWEIWTAEKY